ncbi:hypothetical protein ACKVEX_05030 [Rhodocyclaceae bacterium SMB388]
MAPVLWLPGRNPAMGDAAINAVGLGAGCRLAALDTLNEIRHLTWNQVYRATQV